jgi:hypothetical protein
MEEKYIADIHERYDDFRVEEVVLHEEAVKGIEAMSGSARPVAPLFPAG